MENKVTWWEKTVEYTFLLKFATKTGRQVWPLGGKAELMGDTIYSLDKVGWGLFEFKCDKASLKTEIAKFAVDTEEYKVALSKVRTLKRALEARRTAHSANVSSSSNAGVEDVEEPESPGIKLAVEAHEAARLALADIQKEAFSRAQVFFDKQVPGPTYHFLVYGEKVEGQNRIALYSKPYFDLLTKSGTPGTIITDGMDAFVKWDKTSFAGYLREFMNFKRFGVAISDETGTGGSGDTDGSVGEAVHASGEKAADPAEANGGLVPVVSGRNGGNNATKEWQVGDIKVGDYPTYIIGVDEERIIVAPLDESKATLRLLNYISHRPEPAQTPPVTPPQTGLRPKGTRI